MVFSTRAFGNLYSLKTGIIIIGWLGIFTACYNELPAEITVLLKGVQLMVPCQSANLSAALCNAATDVRDDAIFVNKLQIGVSLVDLVTSVYLLIPVTMHTGHKYMGLQLIWVGWNIIKWPAMISYTIWLLEKSASSDIDVKVSKVVLDVLLKMYFVLLTLSYYVSFKGKGRIASPVFKETFKKVDNGKDYMALYSGE